MNRKNLIDKILKSSVTKNSATINKSEFLNEKDMIPTAIPMLNVAYSGDIDGGLTPGLTQIAGPSKHFKSLLMLLSMKAYLDQYPDAIAILFDSEFGTPLTYFSSLGMDPNDERIIHSPITDIEELRHEIAQNLKAIDRGDKVFIGIDSVGNLASRKEVDDAEAGKTVADMTRAKQLKSLFRIITPHLTIKDIPMVVVNHTYKEIGLFPKDIVGGGTGAYYSADTIWIMGRQQEKNTSTKEITGYNFIINVEKSRFVKEKSKIPISVAFQGGVEYYSGLLELAELSGHFVKATAQSYNRVDVETGEILSDKTFSKKTCQDHLDEVLKLDSFKEFVRTKYQLGAGNLITKEIEEDVALDLDALEKE